MNNDQEEFVDLVNESILSKPEEDITSAIRERPSRNNCSEYINSQVAKDLKPELDSFYGSPLDEE